MCVCEIPAWSMGGASGRAILGRRRSCCWGGLAFCLSRSFAVVLRGALPACCVPKVGRMETGEVLCERVYMSPRPPPKISLEHEWKREIGSEHAQQSEASQLSGCFQSNQPALNPIRERSERPDITHDVISVQDERNTSRSQEIDVNFSGKNLFLQSEP